MTLGIALDLLIVCLLVATVAYAAILNRRLVRLRRDGKELHAAVASFDAVIERAEASIAALKAAGGSAAGRPADGLAESAGGELADDLRFLIERGEAVADRLEAAASDARDRSGAVELPSGGMMRSGGLAAALDGVR
ncbi:MAG: hypothetical protein HOH66_00535 [Rhodospirillaceae bacterium]|mgnify:CR=1 FL=1|jgi:hypothetical protein|nr:hypothetical protein [Rhodospirillaceae bacterium]